LEAGLKKVQERLKALDIHGHFADEPDSDQAPGAGRGSNLK
jgi:hypothetical protein